MIPDPKCFNGIRKDLASNAFKDTQHAYDDIKLIFLNALHYNQEDSQIAKDANTLMVRQFAQLMTVLFQLSLGHV